MLKMIDDDYLPVANDNWTQISSLTAEVVGVQYRALGPDSVQLDTVIENFAKNSVAMLHALGINKDQLKTLVDLTFTGESKLLDDTIADTNIAMLTLESSLSIDPYESTRSRLVQIIKNPSQFSVSRLGICE